MPDRYAAISPVRIIAALFSGSKLMRGFESRHQHRLVHLSQIAPRRAHAAPTARNRRKCLWRLLAKEVAEIGVEHQIEIAFGLAKGGEDLARRAKCEPVEMRRLAGLR